jgi:hypothetical protein
MKGETKCGMCLQCNIIQPQKEDEERAKSSWRVLVMGIWGILVLLVPFWSISLQTEEETGAVLANPHTFHPSNSVDSQVFCLKEESLREEKNGSTVSNIAGNFSKEFFYLIALIPICKLVFI